MQLGRLLGHFLLQEHERPASGAEQDTSALGARPMDLGLAEGKSLVSVPSDIRVADDSPLVGGLMPALDETEVILKVGPEVGARTAIITSGDVLGGAITSEDVLRGKMTSPDVTKPPGNVKITKVIRYCYESPHEKETPISGEIIAGKFVSHDDVIKLQPPGVGFVRRVYIELDPEEGDEGEITAEPGSGSSEPTEK